jgi:AcrR family transcriptional regulator
MNAVERPIEGARMRIVAATRRNVLASGESAASSGRVARDAEVSKALVHYHFPDKRSLLMAVVAGCEQAITRRGVAAAESARGRDAFDACRKRLVEEIQARDLEILSQLARSDDWMVNEAARGGIRHFRENVAGQIEDILKGLGLIAMVHPDLIAELVATTVMGLASGSARDEDDGQYAVLDALWLSVLNLAR